MVKTWNKRGKNRLGIEIFLIFSLLFLSIIITVSVGSANLSILTVWQVISSHVGFGNQMWEGTPADSIIWNIRLPRVMLALIVGAALSLSGVTFQGILRNPLADPFVLGVSSGAALGAAFVIVSGWPVLFFGQWAIPIFAFITALITLAFVYYLAGLKGEVSLETIILAGVVVQAFAGALLTFIISISKEKLQSIIYWLMGSLALSDWRQGIIVLIPLVIGFMIIWLHSRELNLFALGEREAYHLGTDVPRKRLLLLITASFMASAAVSIAGIIGFVGLVIPHMVRILFGPDHRFLIPLSGVLGAIFLLWADTLARTVIQPVELPIGVITALAGAPLFAYLLKKRRYPL
ncbi:iron ABC transporter permease [Microaerobacter geothermalis]|uniref:FecCD family ABC transporter permease n=1 Tax=Microaerobacter geothermalis TaxID=674972 RepID=UPI001F46848B|nr:iron ABC transporter permease [Microaerobacter geothermalis]MCF6093667.1 iron ABC transporter permease [Microaerobacter geothermalis]